MQLLHIYSDLDVARIEWYIDFDYRFAQLRSLPCIVLFQTENTVMSFVHSRHNIRIFTHDFITAMYDEIYYCLSVTFDNLGKIQSKNQLMIFLIFENAGFLSKLFC